MKMYIEDGNAILEKEYINSFEYMKALSNHEPFDRSKYTQIQKFKYTFDELLKRKKEIENQILETEKDICLLRLNISDDIEYDHKKDRLIAILEDLQDELKVVESLIGLY